VADVVVVRVHVVADEGARAPQVPVAPAPDGRVFAPLSPNGRSAARMLYLDLGFAERLGAPARQQ